MIITSHADADIVIGEMPSLVTILGDPRVGCVYLALAPIDGKSFCTALDGPYIGVQDAVMFHKLVKYHGIVTLRNENA